ncbi:hypothetical protein PA598K_01456 [Paenibacillus sp. 598K]|nr:hypothetical protein PA598K_01456 [Paenibacillus sp. 598K]
MPDEPNLDRFSRPLWRELPFRKPSEDEMEDYREQERIDRYEAAERARREARVRRDPFYPPAWAEEEGFDDSQGSD